jgi:hypothetical protein
MSNQVVGTLSFDYDKLPYTYVNKLNDQYSEYRFMDNLYEKGTNNIIGTLHR